MKIGRQQSMAMSTGLLSWPLRCVPYGKQFTITAGHALRRFRDDDGVVGIDDKRPDASEKRRSVLMVKSRTGALNSRANARQTHVGPR